LSSCISVLYNNLGSYASENSWDITDASGTVLISGGNVGSGGDFGNGCIVMDVQTLQHVIMMLQLTQMMVHVLMLLQDLIVLATV
jgi:hypothetical protein